MKVLLVNGSPHRQGCTYTALREIAKTLAEEGIDSDRFWIGGEPIGGCIACRKCSELGRCAREDSVNECAKLCAGIDGFVFGTPVHFASANGSMSAFMDRFFFSQGMANSYRDLSFKPAAAIVTARRAGTTATFDQMNKYLTIAQMPIVSSCYWNMVHGNKPEEVLQDEEGLYIMRVLARNMAFMLKCKRAGLAAGVSLPAREPRKQTNFIR